MLHARDRSRPPPFLMPRDLAQRDADRRSLRSLTGDSLTKSRRLPDKIAAEPGLRRRDRSRRDVMVSRRPKASVSGFEADNNAGGLGLVRRQFRQRLIAPIR